MKKIGAEEWKEYYTFTSLEQLVQFPIQKCVLALFYGLHRCMEKGNSLPEHVIFSYGQSKK